MVRKQFTQSCLSLEKRILDSGFFKIKLVDENKIPEGIYDLHPGDKAKLSEKTTVLNVKVATLFSELVRILSSYSRASTNHSAKKVKAGEISEITNDMLPIKTGKGITEVWVGPGEFIFGRKSAAKELKMKPSTVRNRILKLKSMGNLDIQSNTHYSIIIIINWDTYQGTDNSEGHPKRTPRGQPKDTNKNDKKKELYSLTSIEVRLSELLLNCILERRNGFKRPDLQKWAYEVDKIIRLDGRDPVEIERVIIWCQQDEFWQNNILSTAKLRKQYDQLALKMGEGKSEEEEDAWSHIPDR